MFTAYKIINFISFTITIVFNILTIKGFGPFKSISNISNIYQNSLTPPNWTFSIWGLIYSGLLLFNIAQFIPKLQLDKTILKINYLFPLSCICNIAWLLVFGLQTNIAMFFSSVIIIILMIILFKIQTIANIFKNKKKHSSKIICVDIPFSLYLGWIIFAMFANIGTVVKAWLPENKINPLTFYIVSIILSTFLYLINLFHSNNYVTHLVFLYVISAFITKYYEDNLHSLYFSIAILIFSFICLFIKTIIDCNRLKKIQNNYYFTPFVVGERIYENDAENI